MVHVAGKITGTEIVNLGEPAKELIYQINFLTSDFTRMCRPKLQDIYIYFVDSATFKECAGVAQSVEQLICNQQVAGSTPVASSN